MCLLSENINEDGTEEPFIVIRAEDSETVDCVDSVMSGSSSQNSVPNQENITSPQTERIPLDTARIAFGKMFIYN